MPIRCLVLAIVCLAATESQGVRNIENTKKQIQFFGQVDAVDLIHNTATIRHGPISGHAARGVDDYSVADQAALEKLQPGDDIRAIVHEDERVLYNVQIVYRGGDNHKGHN